MLEIFITLLLPLNTKASGISSFNSLSFFSGILVSTSGFSAFFSTMYDFFCYFLYLLASFIAAFCDFYRFFPFLFTFTLCSVCSGLRSSLDFLSTLANSKSRTCLISAFFLDYAQFTVLLRHIAHFRVWMAISRSFSTIFWRFFNDLRYRLRRSLITLARTMMLKLTSMISPMTEI